MTKGTYWLEHAWLGDRVEPGVAVDVADGRIGAVRTDVDAPPPGAEVLRGLTLPGLANAHSHAFHRALRGTVQVGSGTFWTWREVMYSVADRLTPETYHALARAVYAEMALAGITCVGEFHYVHHAPGGTPYADPNAMGEALIGGRRRGRHPDHPPRHLLPLRRLRRAAQHPPAAVLRRQRGGLGRTLCSSQGAGSRADRGGDSPAYGPCRPGSWRPWRTGRGTGWAPLHVHLSEQTAENDACLAAHGRTPTRLLADHGVLGPRTTGVHNTHLTDEDIALLGGLATGTCMCPTTERDLADGIGPAVALQRAGSPLSLGSDSHAVIDLLEEARAMELNERLRTRTRGTLDGRRPAAGRHRRRPRRPRLGRGRHHRARRARRSDDDRPDSVRTAGPLPRLGAETAVFAASAADVRHTVVGGRHVVRDGAHTLVPDVPHALARAVEALRA